MGVPGFSTWLKRRYPEAFQRVSQRQSFDHVYVDLPSTLHVVTRKARSKYGLHHLLHRRLDDLLAATSPRRRVVLALDGPAPLAKLLEQRRRRRREAERSIREAAESEAAAAADGADAERRRPRSQELSPLSLTTGSVHMLELHHSLAYYICRRLTDPAYQHLRFEVSDSTVKGEGELKILSRLLQNGEREAASAAAGAVEGANEQQAGQQAQEESHLVVGGDSDLILMGMISGQRGLIICDDAHDMGGPAANPDRARYQRGWEPPVAFCRDALEAAWRRDHLPPGASDRDVTSLALDLTLLAIMAHSNDYLPGCPGLQLTNKRRPGVWNLYLDMRRQPEWEGQWLATRPDKLDDESSPPAGTAAAGAASAPPGVSLNLRMLSTLLQRYYDQRSMTTREEGSAEGLEEGSWEEGSPSDSGEDGGAAGGALAGGGNGTKQYGRHTTADPGSYIRGLEWTLSMYSTAAVGDYRYSYFGGPPTLGLLISHMNNALQQQQQRQQPQEQQQDGQQQDGQQAHGGVAAEEGAAGEPAAGSAAVWQSRDPLTPAACALALLPARGRRHAATALRHLMDADSPVAEIYAVCHECRGNGDQIRAVGREFDSVRGELTALQSRLAAASLDADGAVDAAGDLLAAAERCEAAQLKLRRLLADLSRSQQEHQQRSHPPKPFPTAELEAAVAAVPLEAYPRRERRLARFGREMVYTWMSEEEAAAAAAAADAWQKRTHNGAQGRGEPQVRWQPPKVDAGEGEGEGAGRPPMRFYGRGVGGNFQFAGGGYVPGWLRDCMSFAGAYPKLTEPEAVRTAAVRVSRQILPLHPYMRADGGRLPLAPVAARLQARSSGSLAGVASLTRQLRSFASGTGFVRARPAMAAMALRPVARPGPRPAAAALARCAAKLLPRLRMI